MNRTFDYSTITALPKRETCKFPEFFTDFLSFFSSKHGFYSKTKTTKYSAHHTAYFVV